MSPPIPPRSQEFFVFPSVTLELPRGKNRLEMLEMAVAVQNYTLVLQLGKWRHGEQTRMYPGPTASFPITIPLTCQESCSAGARCEEDPLYLPMPFIPGPRHP